MNLKIGVGKHDITGPCAEVTFMGMSNLSQRGLGIHSRLFSRAFVFEDLDNGKHAVLVTADLGMCFQAVQQAVIKRLKKHPPFKVNGRFIYNEKNVLISGNHTHSGPGGYSHHFVYNLAMIDLHAASGFNGQNFDVIVEGIYRSIVKAHNSKKRGKILMARGDLGDCGNIRSVDAYVQNPEVDETAVRSLETVEPMYREMTLLKFVDDLGRPFGSLNWFAVHPTNMGEKNRLISGDNKGYAEELFENRFSGVTAAFANSCCGDISPNAGFGRPDGKHDYRRTVDFGTKQFQRAAQLYEEAVEELDGGIDFRQTYVDMSHCEIEGTGHRTWPAAFGLGMSQGSSEDSKGPGRWPEGTKKPEFKKDPQSVVTLERLLATAVGIHWPFHVPLEIEEGHGSKPIFVPLGLCSYKGKDPVVPFILPLQLIKLGNLVIIAHPGELTTVAGIRLRKTVLDILDEASTGVNHAVVGTYSGAFSSYTTTKEEYDLQHYEGASTLFGPWTLAAYQQENARLARTMKENKTIPAGPKPPDLSRRYRKRITGVRPENKPVEAEFGDIEGHRPKSSYSKGDTVEVSFWGGNPNNILKTQSTYLEVQKKTADRWETIFTDKEFCTYFKWHRRGLSSVVTIKWDIPENQEPGIYRICYYGHWKHSPKRLIEISGQSSEFAVV